MFSFIMAAVALARTPALRHRPESVKNQKAGPATGR